MKRHVPEFFYKTESIDRLKEILELLPHMVEHPDFPFGAEVAFTALAAHISHFYKSCYPE
jgi:hypothetical protein